MAKKADARVADCVRFGRAWIPVQPGSFVQWEVRPSLCKRLAHETGR